ncbi:uncharacterized protein EV420DRAFT_1757217 [Desarmillaria tabescens]|uniref:Uncharacterized protein n=1 Tax=Armillaria tabescens TaxID=1929756 RepID=A0AA39NPK9_ARMTA|nr:uncharacterized protein EV420DRAFT_1757217 [Desarmillaria tabescens]KAK0469471.1 hypothetical protein EV420DRAFT_1757217 [Desarmillaria tabescens]
MVEQLSPYDLVVRDTINCVSLEDENESSNIPSHSTSTVLHSYSNERLVSGSGSPADSSQRLRHITVSYTSTPLAEFQFSETPPQQLSTLSRNRRAPSPSSSPPMTITSSSTKHTLDVHLPPDIQPEMVTISAQKGDKLKVVADAWHMESNCPYEWLITFPPLDIDMSTVHAKFGGDGLLSIDVCRIRKYS